MNNIEERIADRIKSHCDETKYRWELGKACLDDCAIDILKDVLELQEQKKTDEKKQLTIEEVK